MIVFFGVLLEITVKDDACNHSQNAMALMHAVDSQPIPMP